MDLEEKKIGHIQRTDMNERVIFGGEGTVGLWWRETRCY